MNAKSDAKHTPGPWTINPASPRDHHRDSVIVDDAGDRIALVRGQNVVDSIHIANARLIAAAPDLLAACEDALSRLNSSRFSTAADDDIVTSLRAAIAAAKGGVA